MTSSSSALNFGARWYVLDAWAIFGRYYRGGLGFDSKWKDIHDFTGDEYLSLDGYEFGFTFYLGNVIMGDSKFNPYFTTAVGKMDWSLESNGRGSDAYTILDEPVEGNDYVVGAGFGNEYPITDNIDFEFEWYWRYVRTQDGTKWSDTTTQWTNTHIWDLSVGLSVNF